jgi:hypothetical protein
LPARRAAAREACREATVGAAAVLAVPAQGGGDGVAVAFDADSRLAHARGYANAAPFGRLREHRHVSAAARERRADARRRTELRIPIRIEHHVARHGRACELRAADELDPGERKTAQPPCRAQLAAAPAHRFPRELGGRVVRARRFQQRRACAGFESAGSPAPIERALQGQRPRVLAQRRIGERHVQCRDLPLPRCTLVPRARGRIQHDATLVLHAHLRVRARLHARVLPAALPVDLRVSATARDGREGIFGNARPTRQPSCREREIARAKVELAGASAFRELAVRAHLQARSLQRRAAAARLRLRMHVHRGQHGCIGQAHIECRQRQRAALPASLGFRGSQFERGDGRLRWCTARFQIHVEIDRAALALQLDVPADRQRCEAGVDRGRVDLRELGGQCPRIGAAHLALGGYGAARRARVQLAHDGRAALPPFAARADMLDRKLLLVPRAGGRVARVDRDGPCLRVERLHFELAG